jgi:hypothetical protein
VLPEIVAAQTADPNMYIWPEINPGGLIAPYKDVKPSDQSFPDMQVLAYLARYHARKQEPPTP